MSVVFDTTSSRADVFVPECTVVAKKSQLTRAATLAVEVKHMNKSWLSTTSALMLIGAVAAQAQARSEARIRVAKDEVTTSNVRSTMVTNYAPNDSLYIVEARTTSEWYRPTGTTCSSVDLGEDQNLQIKSDLYNPATMISPDQAKQ